MAGEIVHLGLPKDSRRLTLSQSYQLCLSLAGSWQYNREDQSYDAKDSGVGVLRLPRFDDLLSVSGLHSPSLTSRTVQSCRCGDRRSAVCAQNTSSNQSRYLVFRQVPLVEAQYTETLIACCTLEELWVFSTTFAHGFYYHGYINWLIQGCGLKSRQYNKNPHRLVRE